MKAILHFYT